MNIIVGIIRKQSLQIIDNSQNVSSKPLSEISWFILWILFYTIYTITRPIGRFKFHSPFPLDMTLQVHHLVVYNLHVTTDHNTIPNTSYFILNVTIRSIMLLTILHIDENKWDTKLIQAITNLNTKFYFTCFDVSAQYIIILNFALRFMHNRGWCNVIKFPY